jgi:hypothetical protein
MGAPVLGIMGQRLAVKAQRVDPVQPLAKRRMRGLDHPRRRLGAVIARPGAQRAAQHRAFLVGIGPVARLAQRQDLDAVGLHHGQVDPVQRGARHEPRDGPAPAPFSFIALPAIAPVYPQNGRDRAMTYQPKSDFLRVMIERGFLADCTDMQGLTRR